MNKEEGGIAGSQLAAQSVVLVAGAAACLAGLLAAAGRWVVTLLAPGFLSDRPEQAVELLRIGLLGFPLAAVTMVCTAVLQSRERFGVPAFGTPIYNGVLIAAICLWVAPDRLRVLAWAVTAAAALRLGTQAVQAWQVGSFSFRGSLRGIVFASRWNGSLVRRYMEALGAIGLTILNPVIARAIASGAPGEMAAVHFAYRLLELAVGLFAAVLSTVLFPRLTAFFLEADRDGGTRLARQGAVFNLLVTLPLTACVVTCAAPIVAVLFGYGRITGEEIRELASLLRIVIVALPASSLIVLAIAICHAQRETRFPFRASAVTAVIHLSLAWLAHRQWGSMGLMAAGVFSAWLQAAILVIGLARHHGVTLWSRTVLRDAAIVLVLAFAVGSGVWLLEHTGLNVWCKLLGSALFVLSAVVLAFLVGLRSLPSPRTLWR